MNILITGGAGYIGSVLVPQLLLRKKGTITVIDNFMYNQSPLLEVCHDKNLQIIRGDVRDKRLIAEHMKHADFILPLACLTGAPICDKNPWVAKEVNYEVIKNMLDLKSDQQAMIFPNTNSGYGVGKQNVQCNETSPLNPVSLYGRLKVEAESYLMTFQNTIAFRLATVFGMSPRMRLDLLVNDFTYRAVNDGFIVLFEGHFKRNYIHVRDVCNAFIYCIDNFERMKGEIYNIGLSDANLSKLELCYRIQTLIPNFCFSEEAIAKDPDKRNYIVSNDKIEKRGYSTNFTLEDGIQELIKGFQILSNNSYSNL